LCSVKAAARAALEGVATAAGGVVLVVVGARDEKVAMAGIEVEVGETEGGAGTLRGGKGRVSACCRKEIETETYKATLVVVVVGTGAGTKARDEEEVVATVVVVGAM
jgi:hypothetical protein